MSSLLVYYLSCFVWLSEIGLMNKDDYIREIAACVFLRGLEHVPTNYSTVYMNLIVYCVTFDTVG